MMDNFFSRYFSAFHSIEGWFSFDAALLFIAYSQLIAEEGVAGDVLEIGVHHGLSAICAAAVRAPAGRLVAVDLFEELQAQNVSGSGSGDLRIFLENMRSFYDDISFVTTIARPSTELTPVDIGTGFSFCNIDGGHSQEETYHDLDLCNRVLVSGGLVALDDYYNPLYPGVCEGAVKFMLSYPDDLKPLAVAYNKVLLQKQPVSFDLNAKLAALFPRYHQLAKVTKMWNSPILLLDTYPLRAFVDLAKSEANRLVPAETVVFEVGFRLDGGGLTCERGQEVRARVTVTNHSAYVLETVYPDIGLTYHLRSSDNTVLAWDSDRIAFKQPLQIGHSATLDLPVRGPDEPGEYLVEIDLVWERVMWFQETGNQTLMVKLTVV
jgi:hypothetical protein